MLGQKAHKIHEIDDIASPCSFHHQCVNETLNLSGVLQTVSPTIAVLFDVEIA